MNVLTVCSGIGAPECAWKGFNFVGASEIERFPSAVLAHHFPDTPNLGDMTQYEGWKLPNVDVLCGGTPCQSFSVAGLRGGMADSRGNLALVYLRLADKFNPRWVVWENVPGVLSSGGGRDFGSFLGGLAELGYGWAYRVIDAQYTRTRRFPRAVPQRRRRVFVVGYLGDWRRAAAVLFDSESLRWNPAPSRKEGQRVAATITQCFGERGVDGEQIGTGDPETNKGFPVIANPLTARMAKGINTTADEGQTPIICNAREEPIHLDNCSLPLGAKDTGHAVIAGFCQGQSGDVTEKDISNALLATGHSDTSTSQEGVRINQQVRRLAPLECERLQGFPDGWTDVQYRGKPASDGPRYKALGNSMAVNVMDWIGQRLVEVGGVEPPSETV